jgi:hypothetical protein
MKPNQTKANGKPVHGQQIKRKNRDAQVLGGACRVKQNCRRMVRMWTRPAQSGAVLRVCFAWDGEGRTR